MKVFLIPLLLFLSCTEYSKQEKCKSFYKNRNPWGIVSCQQFILLESVRQEVAQMGNEKNTSKNFRDYMLLSCILYNQNRKTCSEEDKNLPYFGDKYKD